MSSPIFKAVNFVKRQFAYPSQIDYKGYLPWGSKRSKNSLPLELIDLVQNSPTASSCISTYADFITGEGFNDTSLDKLIINSQRQTFFQFHNIISDSMARFTGFSVLIRFNGEGKPVQFENLPFENCRLGKPDDKGLISKIYYNPYFGTSDFRDNDTVVYDTYNLAAVLEQQAKQGPRFKGQVYWFAVRKALHPFYPEPDYYAARTWMNVEKNAGIYFDNNLENGFLSPLVMKMIGNPNAPAYPSSEDESEKQITIGQAHDEFMTDALAGASNANKLWTFWGSNKEEFPDVSALPTNSNVDMYRVQDEHATKKITIAMKVPAILANISEGVSLGGDGNTIRAAVKLMQQRVKRIQNTLIDFYQDILRAMPTPYLEDIRIIEYNPFPELQNVDPSVWQELTTEERRQWIQDNTEIDLITAEPEVVIDETQPVENKYTSFKNISYNTYPDKAKENIKKAHQWQDMTGNKCLKPAGRKMGEAILNGQHLSAKEIKRISQYLSRNIIHADKPFDKSCDAVMFYAWGGSDMMVWANEKVKELYG